ncbi:MAG: hypothetical protein ACE5G2_03590 [Candidatus Krumholzibacteriia bacterium]
MMVIAFILDHDVIHKILKHLRKTRRDPRALPVTPVVTRLVRVRRSSGSDLSRPCSPAGQCAATHEIVFPG